MLRKWFKLKTFCLLFVAVFFSAYVQAEDAPEEPKAANIKVPINMRNTKMNLNQPALKKNDAKFLGIKKNDNLIKKIYYERDKNSAHKDDNYEKEYVFGSSAAERKCICTEW